MAFRQKHLFNILNLYERQHKPPDLFLSTYFRANKSIGAHDRRSICHDIYRMIRWRGLLDYLSIKPLTWEKRYSALQTDFLKHTQDPSIPPHIRVSFPIDYFQKIASFYGEEKALEICLSCNEEAPTFIRANNLKISRDDLFDLLQKKYEVSKCPTSASGIIFKKKINFFASEEFKAGLFEVQDSGSQQIAAHIDIPPKSQVLDYCSGSGGKTLAIAPMLKGSGQIYLHDIRKPALLQAKERLKRAGCQNAQFFLPSPAYLQKMDILILDVPCSGSGTLRRNPDMKWKFSLSGHENLIAAQRAIFDEALPYLKPSGQILYATCSIFADENEEQINYFTKKYRLKAAKENFTSLPQSGGADGFFGAVLKF